jgi:CheY-like chemotaxis protein
MKSPRDAPPLFLVLDDSEGVRHLVARTLKRLIAGSMIVEATCNAEAIGILSSRQVSGIVEDFQRTGEDAIDLELALIDLDLPRPDAILYTGTELSRVRRAFEERGLTMDERFAAAVPKIDRDILIDRIAAVFLR